MATNTATTTASVFGSPGVTAESDTDSESAQNRRANQTPVGATVDLPALTQDDRARRSRIAAAWKAYRGQWGAGPLKIANGDPDDNVRPNRCMPIVDAGVAFLFGQPVKIEISNDTDRQTGRANLVDNGAGRGTSQAQAYLDDCWGDDDDRMALLNELAMNGAISGSAFVMIVPANPDAGEDLPRLIVLNPENVTVLTDPHDCRTVQEYWIQYEVKERDAVGNEVICAYRKVVRRSDPDGLAAETRNGYDRDDSWTIEDYSRRGGDQAWRLDARTPWPKPWPPIVGCQNLPNPNEYYGLPDLPEDLIELNRALIFNESNTNRIIKHHAHPTRWASGITAAQLSVTPDNILLFQSENAKLNALNAPADLEHAMQFSAQLRADMDEQSQVPSVALGRMSELPRGAISGVTVRALYAPLMAKTIKKRRLYGRLIRLVSQRFLELGTFTAASQARISLHWKDPMPNDDLQAAQAAQAWQQIGVSKDTLLMQGGYDPDTEAAKSEIETTRAMQLQNQGMMPLGQGGMMPRLFAPPVSTPVAPEPESAPEGQQPASPTPAGKTTRASVRKTPGTSAQAQSQPPINHPKAIQARQAAQAAAGKPVTPNGM